ncbi:MAG TPA: glycosyltransferase [Candidatus Acidoferrum sp.]|nr:glycosyltransferase [Candidatus Acidoferrum sp.]
MPRPFVSVLIDTYNHERFIEQAIVSALEQDFPASDREIIVVDDGSTDRTPGLIGKFQPQVRLLRKVNGGQASAFNVGIPECTGQIIAFLDGDDWWASEKLQKVAGALSADAGCGIVGHGIANAFEDGKNTLDAVEKAERLRLNSVAAARLFRLRKSYLGTSRMTVRAEIARQILPVPEMLTIEADEYLFTLAAALSDLVIFPDVLTYYRQHGANLYNAAGGNADGLRRKQLVMAALAAVLRGELPARGLPGDAVECVCEIIENEAQQMRLMLDGGAPWETLRVENAIYGIMHGDAPLSHRAFRFATMVPSLVLPPRWFYSSRRWIGERTWYRRIRQKFVPAPKVTSVAGAEEFKA